MEARNAHSTGTGTTPIADTDEHRLTIRGERGETVSCLVREGHFVLHELQRLRVPTVLVGCRGGGCGVCRVRVTDGTYEAKRMSVRHVPAEDLADGVVLACRIRATSDLELDVLGERSPS